MGEASKTGQVKFLVQGEQGPSGARHKWVDWATTSVFLSGVNGEEWQYYTFYDTHAYLCLISFDKANYTKTPAQSVTDNDGYFVVADEMFFALINFLLVNRLTADHINANNIVAVNVDISGKVTSTQGLIGGIVINSNGLGTPGSQVWEGHPGMFLCPTYIDFNSIDTVYVGETPVPSISGSKLTSYKLEILNPVVGNGITEVLKLICGDIGFKVASNGIFKSTDGGTTWTAM